MTANLEAKLCPVQHNIRQTRK